MTVRRFYCDVESYSDINLKKSGAYVYAESPEFLPLMWSWAWDDEPVVNEVTEDSGSDYLPTAVEDALREAFAGRALIVAHNASFERIVLSAVYRNMGDPAADPYLPPAWFEDPAARAAIRGLPRSLDGASKALKLPAKKDPEGERLIRLFCVPNKEGKRNLLADHPEDAALFSAYCDQDVEVLRALDRALPDWPTNERDVWLLDQTINDRGLQLDIPLVRECVRAAQTNFIVDEVEVMHLTGVNNPGSRDQMLRWLRTRPGLADMTSLAADTVQDRLDDGVDPLTQQVLEARQRLAPTATKKHVAMIAQADRHGVARGQFLYAGAHTGRFSGRGFQPQNLPRAGFDDPDERDAAIAQAMSGGYVDSLTLKKLVRPCMTGPLTVVDYSSIEARVLAWVAGEQWALDAFAAGRDIYVETANRMGAVTGQTYDRQQGKTAVLALGFAGSVGALRKMGAEGEDHELLPLIHAWRDANPAIGQVWRQLKANMPTGGINVGVGKVRVVGKPAERKMFTILPSGRALSYRGLSQRTLTRDDGTTYDSWGFVGNRGMWEKVWTGILTENLVQAIARDLLVAAMLRLESRGFTIRGHVHDECLIDGAHDVEEIASIMCELPDWAEGLPMAAEGAVLDRYAK